MSILSKVNSILVDGIDAEFVRNYDDALCYHSFISIAFYLLFFLYYFVFEFIIIYASFLFNLFVLVIIL